MRIAIIMKRYNKTSYSLPHVCRFGHGTVERLRINGTDLDFSLFRGKIFRFNASWEAAFNGSRGTQI